MSRVLLAWKLGNRWSRCADGDGPYLRRTSTSMMRTNRKLIALVYQLTELPDAYTHVCVHAQYLGTAVLRVPPKLPPPSTRGERAVQVDMNLMDLMYNTRFSKNLRYTLNKGTRGALSLACDAHVSGIRIC